MGGFGALRFGCFVGLELKVLGLSSLGFGVWGFGVKAEFRFRVYSFGCLVLRGLGLGWLGLGLRFGIS